MYNVGRNQEVRSRRTRQSYLYNGTSKKATRQGMIMMLTTRAADIGPITIVNLDAEICVKGRGLAFGSRRKVLPIPIPLVGWL